MARASRRDQIAALQIGSQPPEAGPAILQVRSFGEFVRAVREAGVPTTTIDPVGGLPATVTVPLALAAGLVMGIMIIPFVSSMADDSIAAVPAAMRDGSFALAFIN